MKKLIGMSLITLSIVSSNSKACDIHGKSGFMPENNYYIPAGIKAMGGISEQQFNHVADKITQTFSSFIKQTGRALFIQKSWQDGTVNSVAHQNTAGTDTIVMYGGLARYSLMTEDAMALVVCHELGHHMGGAPKKSDPTTKSMTWASNEGQADYWGAMKCLRKYFENDDNTTAIKNLNVPTVVSTKCQQIYPNADESALCIRTSMAGFVLGEILNALGKGANSVSFTTPDQSKVLVTFDDHPQAQCRLDTYFQGSLCDHGFNQIVSNTDANTGVCSQSNGDKVGSRPLCWFKP
jgi:hypothetical protein